MTTRGGRKEIWALACYRLNLNAFNNFILPPPPLPSSASVYHRQSVVVVSCEQHLGQVPALHRPMKHCCCNDWWRLFLFLCLSWPNKRRAKILLQNLANRATNSRINPLLTRKASRQRMTNHEARFESGVLPAHTASRAGGDLRRGMTTTRIELMRIE